MKKDIKLQNLLKFNSLYEIGRNSYFFINLLINYRKYIKKMLEYNERFIRRIYLCQKLWQLMLEVVR